MDKNCNLTVNLAYDSIQSYFIRKLKGNSEIKEKLENLKF